MLSLWINTIKDTECPTAPFNRTRSYKPNPEVGYSSNISLIVPKLFSGKAGFSL